VLTRSLTELAPAHPHTARDPDEQTRSGLTLRAAGLGIAIVVVINLWVTYAETVLHTSRLSLSFFQLPLFFVFVILLGIVNPLLTRTAWLRPLTSPEILTVIAIGMVGCVVPASGVTGFLMGVISVPFYFATPENAWDEYFHPHLSPWLVPTDPELGRSFYEGLVPGQTVNWHLWLSPIFWWTTLVVAILLTSACTMVILRRQWADHEKLTYPLVTLPLEIMGGDEAPGTMPRMFRAPLFLVGAGIAFLLFAWNALSWFYPAMPGISAFPNTTYYTFTRFSPGIYVNPFQFFTIAFAYFANLQLLFSIWVLYAVYIVECVVLDRLGYQIRSSSDAFSADPPTQAWKCFGALVFLVLWRLWISRSHLRAVLAKAIDPRHPLDDTNEMLSYRTCVVGLLFGGSYVLFWLHRAGMDFLTATLFLMGLGITYLGIARVVSETGVPYAQATVTPQAFAMDLRGSSAMSGSTLTALVLSYSLIDYTRGLFTPGLAHVAHLSERIRGNRRALLFCVTVGVLSGLAASVWLTLHLAHTHGAFNFPRFPFFNGDPKGVYSSTLTQMRTPSGPDLERYGFLGIGLAEMGMLTFLNYRFGWWPLHPVGLVLSASDNHKSMVLPVFIAWAAKSICLRVGGVQLYDRMKPLVVGLLVGYTFGVILSFGVDAFLFPGEGHELHSW